MEQQLKSPNLVVSDTALAPLPQAAEMQQRISALQARYLSLVEFKEKVLVRGVDYGSVGDSETEVLHQPGAQKLGILFGLHPHFDFVERVEDWTGEQHGEPFFRYLVKCTLYDDTGAFVAESYGEVNSWESRYRWRWLDESQVPAKFDRSKLARRVEVVEEFAFAIEKAETSGKYGKPAEYWEQFKLAIADGKAVRGRKKTRNGNELDTWAIETVRIRVPNEDIFSQVNNMIKMAQKRAFVGAILVGTGAAQFFTQDLDDMAPETLEAMGIRQGRNLTEPDATPTQPVEVTRSQRNLNKPSQQSTGDSTTINWRSGPGAKIVPELRKITGLSPAKLFERLESTPGLSLDMTAAEIAQAISGSKPAETGSKPEVEDKPLDRPLAPPDLSFMAEPPSDSDLPF